MIRTAALLSIYSKRAFLEWMGFRSFLVTLVVNQAVTPMLGLAIWSAALPGQADISTYFVALLAVQLATVSQEYYSVTMRIYEGALTEDLLRPHPFVIAPLGESVAFRSWNVLMGIPIIAMATILTGVSFQITDVIAAIPALILAAILRFLFVYMLALSALWVEQAGAITDLGGTLVFLLGGVAVPIMLFPERIRPLGEALPFRAMLGFPAEIASGSLNTSQIVQGYCWQALWVSISIPLAMVVWKSGVRRFTAVGG
jgi:ABC-2 type transport system permease protein